MLSFLPDLKTKGKVEKLMLEEPCFAISHFRLSGLSNAPETYTTNYFKSDAHGYFKDSGVEGSFSRLHDSHFFELLEVLYEHLASVSLIPLPANADGDKIGLLKVAHEMTLKVCNHMISLDSSEEFSKKSMKEFFFHTCNCPL